MLRLALSLASPAGPRGRLSILIFHRVLSQPDPLFPDLPDRVGFESRMRWVSRWFNVLPLAQAIDSLYAGTLAPRALAITFDDGYADNEEIAAPILERLGLSATIFVSTAFLGGGCMWNDRVIEAIRITGRSELDLSGIGLMRYSLEGTEARRHTISSVLTGIKHLPADRRHDAIDVIVGAAGTGHAPNLMMQPDQVRRWRARGMDVGAHTVTHPILTQLPRSAALNEIGASKAELERILGERVELFAYPNGAPGKDYGVEHASMVRDCGFSAAVSTAWGAASIHSDRFQLPRFSPWDRTRLRYGSRLLANLWRNEEVAS